MIRRIARSIGVRVARRAWNRALIVSTPGTRSRPTWSMTWSENPSSRLITTWVSRNRRRCSSDMRRSSQCPSPPRMARPSARDASRPRSVALRERPPSCFSRRSARYGRSHGCASNSKAWVVSWSAIHVRNGSTGTPRARAVWRMFSSTNRSWPGSASAERSARSYCPSTRCPMKPSSSPNWRVVIQRLASAIDAFPRPAPGGTIWSSRSRSSRPNRPENVERLARTQPARSTTATRSTIPGSGVSRACSRAGTTRCMDAA